MKIKYTTILLTLLLSVVSYAQEMKISGTVQDTSGTTPLPNALAMAVRVKDSLLLGFARTDSKGYFELKGIQMDTFSLVIAHPNYDDKT